MPTTLPQPALAQLQRELDEVSAQLEAAVAELYPPLDYLARSQLTHVRPLVRAAVVLSACRGAPDHEKLRAQRLVLAAALEMLHIALRIHRILLTGPVAPDDSNADSNQRSVTGSVILTGDYCFTRSAILAAQTDSVDVVAIFSQTLKQISEAILRELFHDQARAATTATTSFNENLALFHAGIEAAAILVPLPSESTAPLQSYATQVAQALAQMAPPPLAAPPVAALTAEQQAHWQALHQWLSAELFQQ